MPQRFGASGRRGSSAVADDGHVPTPDDDHHAVAVTFRGEIVVMGGFLAAPSRYDRPSDRVLALRAGAWVDLPPLRRRRARVGDQVLALVGGTAFGVAPSARVEALAPFS